MLPCDHLPLEIQPKEMTDTEKVSEKDEDEDDECHFYYESVLHHEEPIVDRPAEQHSTVEVSNSSIK